MNTEIKLNLLRIYYTKSSHQRGAKLISRSEYGYADYFLQLKNRLIGIRRFLAPQQA